MKKNDSFLENIGIPMETLKAIQQALRDVFIPKEKTTIRLAVIGECGVGKTSTINALFNTDMPVSHFGSCTQQAKTVQAKTPNGVFLEVIDLPGLWAGETETKKHWETYKKVIPTVDSAIWVISAGDRALEGMQKALKSISNFSSVEFINRIVFGINKAEHMYPENWNNSVNLPSTSQTENLELFCKTVKNAILEVFPNWNGTITYYSAHKHFRLNEILEQMLLTTSSDSRLKILGAAAPKEYKELIEDKRALKVAEKLERRGV